MQRQLLLQKRYAELAFRNMKTLYLRNVPDEVTDRLERLAAREGLSVSALALRELAEASKRADNAALLSGLGDIGVTAEEVVRDIDAGRPAA